MPDDLLDPNRVTEADFDLEDLEEDAPIGGESHGRDARMAICAAAFEAAASSSVRRKLHDRKESLAVVVQVPTPAWVAPIGAYCAKAFGGSWKRVLRDGADTRHHRAEKGSDEVALDLTECSVVGVAADVGVLPSVLVAAADVLIEILPPSGNVMSDAVARYCGKPHQCDFSGLTVVGLDFPDILAAFRSRSSARNIRNRLAAASARIGLASAVQDMPALRTAVEYGEARIWALELVKDLADFRAGRIPWSALSRGAVVFSEPGLGKSLWARMVAKECGIPILESSVADWLMNGSGNLSDVIRAERSAFSQARTLAAQATCCLMLWDEVDAIPNRATMSERNRDYWTPLLNDILTNLDNGLADKGEGCSRGGGKRGRIIVVGATNRIADLDPALMRPGRLERAIEIKRPDFAGTLNILRHHVAGDVPERDLGEIAGLIERSTGAEIMQYVRDARRLARRRAGTLSLADLRTAVLPKSDLAPHVLWRICVHEAGHAVGTLALDCGVVKRCVVRDGAGRLGETLAETTDANLPTKADIEKRVVAVLCGRAAEEAVFGDVSANAGGDLKSDLAIATRFVGCLHVAVGLGGSLAYLAGPNEVADLLRNDRRLRQKVDRHLAQLYRRAMELMMRHREVVVAIADRLRVHRFLSGEEILRLYDTSKKSSPVRDSAQGSL